jgi:hypothetical protein
MNEQPEFKLIVGNIQFKDIETGYWEFNDGERAYRIVNIPVELMKAGLNVATMSQILDEEISIFSTTLNIKIIEFKILS